MKPFTSITLASLFALGSLGANAQTTPSTPATPAPAATAPAATAPGTAGAATATGRAERGGHYHQHQHQHPHQHPHHQRGERLKAADKDGDGALSKAEVEAAGMKRMITQFDAMDANRDGKLTQDEMRAFKAARHGRPADGMQMPAAKP